MSGTESLPSSSNLNLEPAVRATPFLQGVQQCFDKAAITYQQGALLQRDVAHDLHQLLLQTLSLDGGDAGNRADTQRQVLLDLGCGGLVSTSILSVSCDELIALDLSQAMLAQAKTAGIAKQFIHADAAAIPLADQSVDQSISFFIMQWCGSTTPAIPIARVLKPGGVFRLSTHS
ncbi:MAG: methyltransferase domain-containing protein [Rheinheimera sp.]|nr:methyltransferase domain-containing protein [Rheinheimera sp.]